MNGAAGFETDAEACSSSQCGAARGLVTTGFLSTQPLRGKGERRVVPGTQAGPGYHPCLPSQAGQESV